MRRRKRISSSRSSRPRRRGKARGWGSLPCTGSSSRAAATSGCTPSWATAPPSRSTRPAPTIGGSETVLLAEDEAAVRAVARQTLERHGYTVLESPSAEAALDLAHRYSGRIHLLLTDVVMPGMSGRALALRLVELRPELRVIYMSGYTGEAITRHGMLEPGLTYVQKPFTPNALARIVRETLDGEN